LLKNTVGTAVAMVLAIAPTASAQTKPWELFLDSASSSACDVINADNNAKLVLLTATNQLSIVTGTDVTLQDTQVDADGFVTFEGNPAGAIGFATDGDGKRTVWWMSLTGTVVNVNGFTGEPTQTNKLPSDFVDVACDACQFWDDATVCAAAPPPEPPPPPITVNLCGQSIQIPIGLTAAGLATLSFVRCRRRGISTSQEASPQPIDG
jgi:hypothetical protein